MPITTAEANAYVKEHHRHHKPLKVGYVFSLAVIDETGGAIRGVAIVGRPCSQYLWDGFTLEVRRVATDGCPNACSALYAAALRVAKALGYKKLITYTLASESGASLRGAWWDCSGKHGGGSWNTARSRADKHPTEAKLRWEKT